MGWSEVQTLTAVFSPPRPPADRRLSEVRRGDQRYSMPRYPSRAAWEERKAHLRRQILTAAGLWPEPERTPLQPIRTGRVERDGYSVENVALQSRPGFYVTGNLYLPLNVGGPYPAILNPHGHSRKGRLEHSEIFSTPLRCISLARQGYAAFAYDMVGYNDARQIRHDFGSWPDWLWSLGALGLQLWNSRRALDFLLSLPEVDPARLGCTGESGGGTQTFLLAAVDERVTHVAPNVMVSAHFQGGCVCENIPNLRLDTFNVEIAAMAAPRPMILVSATGDWTRNTPTVEYPAIREVYALYGAEERLSEQQIEAPHNYNQESREAVYRFFGHWFKGLPSDTATREEPLTPPEEATLRVFLDQLPSGALDEDGLRRSVVALTKQQLTDAWPDGRANLAAFRERFDVSYRYSLDTEPPGPDGVDVKRLGEGRFGDWSAQRLAFGRLREGTPAGDSIPALFFGAQEGRPLLVVHGAGKAALFGGSDGEAVPGRLLTALLRRQRPLLVIDAWLTGDYITPGAHPGRRCCCPLLHHLQPRRRCAARAGCLHGRRGIAPAHRRGGGRPARARGGWVGVPAGPAAGAGRGPPRSGRGRLRLAG